MTCESSTSIRRDLHSESSHHHRRGKDRNSDVPTPSVGPTMSWSIRACGICGTDTMYISIGGLPPRHGCMPIGHEPAGEVTEVGGDVSGIAVGDRVVINPMAVGRRHHRQRRLDRRAGRLPTHQECRSGSQPRGHPRPHPVRGRGAQRTHGGRAPCGQSGRTQARRTRCWY